MRISRASSWFAALLASCAADQGVADVDVKRVESAALHPVELIVPTVLRGLPLTLDGGQVAVTPCTTCHGAVDPTPLPARAEGIGGPHAGLTVRHGMLSCASCHHPSRRDQLRLADGRSVLLIEAMELCAQCHGPQKRDFDHGAHGGMRGYWDLRKGPRERNHCVACHDPHAPRFGTFAPVEGPRDRFTSQHAQGDKSHE